MMSPKKYQVVIVGAGPAGLATSLTLAAYNISHCIIDANVTTPTKKIGDALPPNAKPLLKQLGILPLLNSKEHIPYYGNKSIWGTDTINQKEFLKNTSGHGYLLDRSHFENQLKQLVAHNKTPFYKGCQVKKVSDKHNKLSVFIQKDSVKEEIQANFIVDATGRKASVCRHLGITKKDLDTQLTFSFTHQLKNSIPREIWIEATENGWWYLSPNANNEVNCMFFTLKELTPKKNETVNFLNNELYKTKQIQQIINPTTQEFSNYKCMPTGTSHLKKPYGNNWLAVGDAAFSYDPISSYGITSALASGYYGGHAIAGKLANDEDAFLAYHYVLENGAKAYLKKLVHQYNMEKRWYNSYYWSNRLTNNK